MKQKITFAILALSIFVLSLLPVIAEEDTVVAGNDSLTPVLISAEDSDVVDKDNNSDFGDKAERLGERVGSRIADVKERIANATERYAEARQNYIGLRESYLEKRQTFLKERDQFRDCMSTNSTDCKKVREHAKDYLGHIDAMILNSLEKVKAKIEASEDLSDEDKADLIAKIDERIASLGDANGTIANSGNNTEIRDAAKEIKQEWLKTKDQLVMAAGKVVNARIGGIIVQSEKLSEKLDRIVAKLEEKGKDTANITEAVDAFDAKIAEAKQHYESAKEIFAQAKADNASISDAQKEMKAAHAALKEAREMLKDVVKEIKGTGDGKSEIAKESGRNDKGNKTKDVNDTEDDSEDVNETED